MASCEDWTPLNVKPFKLFFFFYGAQDTAEKQYQTRETRWELVIWQSLRRCKVDLRREFNVHHLHQLLSSHSVTETRFCIINNFFNSQREKVKWTFQLTDQCVVNINVFICLLLLCSLRLQSETMTLHATNSSKSELWITDSVTVTFSEWGSLPRCPGSAPFGRRWAPCALRPSS